MAAETHCPPLPLIAMSVVAAARGDFAVGEDLLAPSASLLSPSPRPFPVSATFAPPREHPPPSTLHQFETGFSTCCYLKGRRGCYLRVQEQGVPLSPGLTALCAHGGGARRLSLATPVGEHLREQHGTAHGKGTAAGQCVMHLLGRACVVCLCVCVFLFCHCVCMLAPERASL